MGKTETITTYSIDYVSNATFRAESMEEALKAFLENEQFEGCRPVKIIERTIEI